MKLRLAERLKFIHANKRRFELIQKKNRDGLTEKETVELAKLQRQAKLYADKIAPLPGLKARLRKKGRL